MLNADSPKKLFYIGNLMPRIQNTFENMCEVHKVFCLCMLSLLTKSDFRTLKPFEYMKYYIIPYNYIDYAFLFLLVSSPALRESQAHAGSLCRQAIVTRDNPEPAPIDRTL